MSRLHRFYIQPGTQLAHNFWLHDQSLIHQWRSVLRYTAGQQVALFDGQAQERLYRITEINEREAHLEHITDLTRNLPQREIYLLFALLKSDKNDWILQKCTELGVSHFMPLVTTRTVNAKFNEERAKKIVIEAAEQCGRSDIPSIRSQMTLETALKELAGKALVYVCAQQGTDSGPTSSGPVAVCVGPEGGWAPEEEQVFERYNTAALNLHDFTLRAETAAVAAVAKLG